MNSLKQVFNTMQSRDHEKVAEARAAQGLPAPRPDISQADPDLLKQAQDYDQIGRILAHNVFADLVKEAVDEAMPGAAEGDKKTAFEEAMAAAMGEKKEKKEGEGEEKKEGDKDETPAEKQAAAKKKAKKKAAILAKMAQDPDYIAQLIAKHQGR